MFKRKKTDQAGIISGMLEDKVQALYQRTAKDKQAPSSDELDELERLSKFHSFVKKKKIPLEKIGFPLVIICIGLYTYHLSYTPQTPIDVYAKFTAPSLRIVLADEQGLFFSTYPLNVTYLDFRNLDSILIKRFKSPDMDTAFATKKAAKFDLNKDEYELLVEVDPSAASADSQAVLLLNSLSFLDKHNLNIEKKLPQGWFLH